MEEYIKQALEIVKAQAGFRTMTEDEISSMVKTVAGAIHQLMSPDSQHQVFAAQSGAKQISERSITCLECGKSFKLLTRRHLLSHGISADEYREKWGYAKDAPLVCKALQRERRKKMRDMKLWEKRRKAV
ncbi:MucR family transcriptional regulator [Desulfovibrio sp. OttesenSCG-928-G15]|nr:MucR family transcriptional regulator [Desulfovibrio sp. OttesenSCG-928-G15]